MENKKHVYDHHEAATDLEQGLLAKSLMDHRRQRQSQPSASGEVKYRLGRVPQHVRDMDDDAYTPRFASIGPLHYSNDAVRSSYSHRLKLAYLHSLITRASPRDDDDILITLQEYRAGVAKLEDEARDFYDEKIKLGSEEFIDMMVLDGCFVLEHLLNYATGHEEPLLHSTHWAPSQLHADLICIENQIPFFVLAELLERTRLPADLDACRTERQDLLRSLGVHCLLRKDDEELKLLKPSREIHHLLHLYSLALTAARNVRPLSRLGWGSAAARALWKLPIMLLMPVAYLLCATPEEEDGAEKMPNIPSAMDLQRVGIKFKKAHKKPDGGFLDVRLEDGDTLVIPTVSIEQFTAPQLQNLIALEQASPELPDDCSSYAFFMDNLVANPCDVALLEAEGILKSNLGSHKAVVTYFNKLCKGNKLELEGHYLSEVFKKLMERSRNPMYAWLRTLRKKYFSSPWGLVAMLVAVFVFASTVLQTYLSIRSY